MKTDKIDGCCLGKIAECKPVVEEVFRLGLNYKTKGLTHAQNDLHGIQLHKSFHTVRAQNRMNRNAALISSI